MRGGTAAASLILALASANAASASLLFNYKDPSGLSAEAEFTFLNPTSLQIRLKNTSTGVPVGFDSADQLLTGVSWTFKAPVTIIGGSVFTGPTSNSLNFSVLNVGSNADVSGEWGYGNADGSGALMNFVSTNVAGAIAFGGANLDGPVNLNGPQAGLVANPILVPDGGLGMIQNEIIATLTLSGAYSEAELLADILANGTLVEFGSDAAFIFIPAPTALALLGVAGAFGRRRRR